MHPLRRMINQLYYERLGKLIPTHQTVVEIQRGKQPSKPLASEVILDWQASEAGAFVTYKLIFFM